jgi:hypothetical protein
VYFNVAFGKCFISGGNDVTCKILHWEYSLKMSIENELPLSHLLNI